MFERLQQVVAETTYNRKNIRQIIAKDVTNSHLGDRYTQAIQLITEYKDKTDYYESKLIRLQAIADWPACILLNEVLIAIMSFTEPQPIQAVAARLGRQLPYENIFDSIKTAAELIAMGCHANLYDIIAARDSETGSMMVHSKYVLEESTRKAIALTRYLPPMVTKPERIPNSQKNLDTSHLTFRDSLILGKNNHHNYPLAVDVLNISNRIALSLDEDILEYAEEPYADITTPEAIEQFYREAADSTTVYNELLEAGNEFYLTNKFDFRGRKYTQGYHVNMQSYGYKKALINLAHKEVIECGETLQSVGVN